MFTAPTDIGPWDGPPPKAPSDASSDWEVNSNNNGPGDDAILDALFGPPGPEESNPFPGLRKWAETDMPTDKVKPTQSVLELLKNAGIPACVVGVFALRYYGAGRASWEWDICIPSSQLQQATQLFETNTLYKPAPPPPKVPASLRHVNPCFQLKGFIYFFILVPSSQQFFEPTMNNCELSKNRIPYPPMAQFARTLLVLQHPSDIADFIDGMDLDEKWGNEHIDFDELQISGTKYTEYLNDEIKRGGGKFFYVSDRNYRKTWNKIVEGKEGRIEPMKKGRYKTRWRRINNDEDPRLRRLYT